MMVDEFDLEGLPVQSMLRATITGRTFAAGGLIGRLCQRMLAEGSITLAEHLDPVDEDEVKARIRSIVSWYRATRDPWWSNGAFSEWLLPQSPTFDELLYSNFAAMAICIDRALVCTLRGRDEEAEEWFSSAEWLKFLLYSSGRIPDFPNAPADDKEIAAKLIKDAMRQKSNLSKGRLNGAQSQKKAAADRDKRILDMNADLLKHPDAKRWTLDKRAAHICDRILKNEKTKERYSPGTIIGKIQGQA